MAIISNTTTMYSRVRQIVDREDVAYFSDTQLLMYTEMATDEYIQQHYNIFETSQDARDKLQKLVVHDTIDIKDGVGESITNMDGTDVYYRLLSAYVTASPNVNVKVIQISDINAYLNDPFNKADSNNPVIYMAGGNIHSIGLGTTDVNVTVKYLKYTVTFTDLDSHTYEEIAQIASRRILATLGDPRYQFLQAELMERLTQLGGGK